MAQSKKNFEVDAEEAEDMPEEVVNSTTKVIQQAIPGVELPEPQKRKKRKPLTVKEWADVADRLKSVRSELDDIYEIVEGSTTAGDAALIGSAIRTLATASRRTEVVAYRQVGKAAVGMFEMEEDQEG
jgi:hypothetical protein